MDILQERNLELPGWSRGSPRDYMCLRRAVHGAPQSERSPKLESPKGKVPNPGVCKAKKMDTVDHTQANSNREQGIYSHHANRSTDTTMSNTTAFILFPLSS